MKTEKEFKRSDNSKAKIKVELVYSYTAELPKYKIEVWHCPANKRKYTFIDISDNYTYRRFQFNSPERNQMELEENLKYVTLEEILEAKLKLWESIKPTLS